MKNLMDNRISNQKTSLNKGRTIIQHEVPLYGQDYQIASTTSSGKKTEKRVIRIPKVNSADAFLLPLMSDIADSIRQFTEQLKEDINEYYLEREREKAERQMQMLDYEDDDSNNNNNDINININSNNNNNNNNSNISPKGNLQISSVLYESKFQDSYLDFNCHQSEEECDEDINEPIRNQNNHVDLNSFIQFPQQQIYNDLKEEDSLFEICKPIEFTSNNNNNNSNSNEVSDVLNDLKNLLFSIPIKIASMAHLMNVHHITTDSLFIPQGKYCKYSSKTKRQFVSMTRTYGVNTVASSFNLSTKTLKRWIDCGTNRKDGGGRKELDPEMEDKLYEWYINNREIRKITPTMIKRKAKEYSNCLHFKASKGWYTKFVKKYKVNLKEDERKLKSQKEIIKNQNEENVLNEI